MKNFLLSILITFWVFQMNAQSLTASYPFNGNAQDLVTGLSGTVSGAALTSDRFGIPNSAYSFTGSANIAIPTVSIMTNQYSYCAWIKFNSSVAIGSKRAVISVGDISNSADQAMCIANGYSGQYGFTHTAYNSFYSPSNAIEGTYSVNIGTWYYVVSTKSIDTIKVYVNGNLVAKAKFNGTAAGYGSTLSPRATIGSRSNNIQFFDGAIDDIKIYDYPLSSSQIMGSYTGIIEMNNNTNVLSGVYPQPFIDLINIEAKRDIQFQVINLLGRKVAEGKLVNGKNVIDLNQLNPGLYYIVTNEGSFKIVKI